jgi:flagellar protein FliO/FliZ
MDYSTILRAVLSLAFVLGLVGLASVLAKKFLLDRQILKIGDKKKRLSIEEIHPVDAKRRLVLIKRDDMEHLILLGTSSDLLIESIKTTLANENSPLKKKVK